MSLPIVFSPHVFGLKKNSLDELYAPLSISSAEKTNPRSRIYFLNPPNSAARSFGPRISVVDCSSVSNANCLSLLESSYVHLSTNRLDFELFCISRFFHLRDFFRAESLESAITIETDVLLFQDVEQALHLYSPTPNVMLSDNKCISLGLITLEYLEYWCDFVLGIYTSPAYLDKLKSYYSSYSAGGKKGGICDMSFCDYINKGQFEADLGFRSANMSKMVSEASGSLFMFDNFISRPHAESGQVVQMISSEVSGGLIKDFFFEGNNLYTFVNNSPCRMGSLHFQGNAKLLMASVYCSFF